MVFKISEICKQYGDNIVLENISLELQGGKVHGILGYNGAGKSTLGKIVGGVIQKDSGHMHLDRMECSNWDVRRAMRSGVFIVDYHSTLLPELTVRENMLYGLNSIKDGNLLSVIRNKKKIVQRLKSELEHYGLECNMDWQISQVSNSMRNILELLRIKLFSPKVVVVDEIDANVNEFFRERIKKIIRDMAEDGVAVLYISHQIQRVMEISDEISAIMDAHLVETVKVADMKPENVIDMMFKITNEHPPKTIVKPQAKILELKHISNNVISDFSLYVREGEIVGVVGLEKEGPASFGELLFSDKYHPKQGGDVLFREKEISLVTPQDAMKAGVIFLDSNVIDQYLFPGQTVRENMLPFAIRVKCRDLETQTKICQSYLDKLSIKAKPEDKIEHISTGHQKKILIAKNILSEGEVFIFANPTDNIDTVSKIDIYNIMNELKMRGRGIILISNDYHEVAGICDVIVVVEDGKVVRKFNNYALHEKELIAWSGQEEEHDV